MFNLKFELTEKSLAALKTELLSAINHVKSSHRCEAIGRGLGFGTYAASRAAARASMASTVVIDGPAFARYLSQYGFQVSPVTLYHAVAKAALRDIAARNPTLTIWGIGIGRPQRKTDGKVESAEEFYVRFCRARTELTDDDAASPFLLSLALLERVTITKTIRSGTGSYWLKHIAENYACTYPNGGELGPQYVPNGAFIAAAIYAGFKFKSYVDEFGYEAVNVSFNMSRRLLVELDCEIRPSGGYAQDRRRKQEERDEKFRRRELYRQHRAHFKQAYI